MIKSAEIQQPYPLDSSIDSPMPPTRQFSFSEPTDQDQIMLTGNSTRFTEPTDQDQIMLTGNSTRFTEPTDQDQIMLTGNSTRFTEPTDQDQIMLTGNSTRFTEPTDQDQIILTGNSTRFTEPTDQDQIILTGNSTRFTEPTDQDQIILTGNSTGVNLSPKSRTQYSFAAPATQDQYSPVSEIISPLQSQSLFSQTQTPVKRVTNDRFNGILYHIHTTIIFSSKHLYNKFVHSLEKKLHPQRFGESKANYNMHIRGKSCTISTDN